MALIDTTLSSAVTASATSVTLVSATSLMPGQLVLVDQEMMQVGALYTSGTTVPVVRGIEGTASVAHAASAPVTYAPAGDFVVPAAETVGTTTLGTTSTSNLSVVGNLVVSGTMTTGATSMGNLTVTGNETVSGNVGIGTTSPDAKLDVVNSALATTSTDGIVLQNETASTAGVPVQMSPRLTLKGHAWNSTGSADETESFFFENLPATTAGTITGTMKVGFRNNAGTVTYPLTVTSAGAAALTSSLDTTSYVAMGTSGFLNFANRVKINGFATNQLNIYNNADTAGVGFDIATDATLKIRTRAQTADASLTAFDATLTGVLTAGGVGTGTVATFYTGTLANGNVLRIANGAGSTSSTILTRNVNSGLNIPLNIVSSYLQLISDTSGVIGVGLDVTTDATLKIRTRAQTADASLTALDATLSGTLGVTGVSTLTGGAVVQTLTVGKGSGAVSSNTAMGVSALFSNTTGADNTAMGANALSNNTTGASNTAVGRYALYFNTTGANNTAMGASALVSNTTGADNTAVGTNALAVNTTGANNTAVGKDALYLNTTGTNNTALGMYTLRLNTTGAYNTAVGQAALYSNTTGAYNTAVGQVALNANTVGSNNTSVGYGALYANTTGIDNTAVGGYALSANTTGANNTAMGRNALYTNTTGTENTAMGAYSLYANTTGVDNTAIGESALFTNTTGVSNTAMGVNALGANTTGVNNTAIGASALYANTVGNNHTAVGSLALYANTTGTENTAMGYAALFANTTGAFNTAVGRDALSALTIYTNATGLGYQAAVTGSNQVQCGNASTAFYAYGAYNNRSDARDKAVIRDTVLGLDFITALRPRDFKWDYRDDYKPVAPVAPVAPVPPDAPAEPVVPSAPRLLDDRATDADRDAYDEAVRVYTEAVEAYPAALTVYTDAAEAYALVVAAQHAAHTAALDVYHTAHAAWLTAVDLGNIVHDGTHTRTRYHHGLIAQEVQAVIAESGVDFGGFQHHTIKGGQDVMSLGYSELISPLIKAVQELKAQFDAYVQAHP